MAQQDPAHRLLRGGHEEQREGLQGFRSCGNRTGGQKLKLRGKGGRRMMMATSLEQEPGRCQLPVADITGLGGERAAAGRPEHAAEGAPQPHCPTTLCPAGAGKAGNGTGRTAGRGKDGACLPPGTHQLSATAPHSDPAFAPAVASRQRTVCPCKRTLRLQFPFCPFSSAPPRPPQPSSPQPAAR